MNRRDVLSQEEIDALLSGVRRGELDTDAADLEPDGVRTHDLVGQRRPGRGRFPALERMAERFSRQLRDSLSSAFRFPFTAGAVGSNLRPFSELLAELAAPSSLHLIRLKPIAGTSVLVLEADLIRAVVDLYFGGKGIACPVPDREFSSTERRIAERLAGHAFDALPNAWKDLLPVTVEQIGHEFNPGLISQLAGDDVVLQMSFPVQLPSGSGQLQLVLPFAGLEPYEQLLAGSKSGAADQTSQWGPLLERHLLDARVPLQCSVASAEVRLGELLSLKPGDFLPLDMPEQHQVLAAGVPAFIGKMGEAKGKLALEFLDHIKR